MLKIRTTGIKEVYKAIKNDVKQTRFGTAIALTAVAAKAQKEQKKQIQRKLDRPTPFTLRGFRYRKATRDRLQSSVFISPIQAEYLYWSVEGGVRPARGGKAEAVPAIIKLNKYGNIPGRGRAKGQGKIKKLIDRPDTFVGRVKKYPGVYGIWQRTKFTAPTLKRASKAGIKGEKGVRHSRSVRLLVRFERTTRYKKRYDFYKYNDRTFDKYFALELERGLAMARQTAS